MDFNSLVINKNTDITKLFYQCLNEDDEYNGNDDILNHENICHITQDELKENSITMKCGHTFNYIPLFNEIKKQKHAKNYYSNLRLRVHQIQCPYCRQIQDSILPLIENVDRLYGVNYPASYTMKPDLCVYTYKSGKKKGNICERSFFGSYCKYHKHSDKKDVVSKQLCDSVLKSGPRKGTQCGNKVYENGKCKRHSNTNSVKNNT